MIEKFANQAKLAIPSQSGPLFGGKDGKSCKFTKIGQSEAIWAGQNEAKECYTMIETDKNLNISLESQLICMKPS